MLKYVLHTTLQNIVILDKKINEKFFSLNKFSNKSVEDKKIKNNFLLYINKLIEKKTLFSINMKNINNKTLILLEHIIKNIENDKYTYTNKLNLYLYNFNIENKKNMNMISKILKKINDCKIPFNIYILLQKNKSTKNLEKANFYKNIVMYTKFLYVFDDYIPEMFSNSENYEILNISYSGKKLVIINNTKKENVYKISEVTEYNTLTRSDNDILNKYPVLSYHIGNNINKYIFIPLYKNNNLKEINKLLYFFLNNTEKEIYNVTMLNTINLLQTLNLNENVSDYIDDIEYPLNIENIEKIKFLVFNFVKEKKNINTKNIKKEIINMIDFFDVSKENLNKIIYYLNYFNVNLLNNPFIKTKKYIEYK